MESSSWENEWGRSLRTAEDLLKAGLIAGQDLDGYRAVAATYKLCIPRYYAGLIDLGDPACPIRRQAVPELQELRQAMDGFTKDPLRDLDHQPTSRITHRYQNRALFHLTPNCSMYCRYCFRKSLLNELSPELFGGGFEQPLCYLQEHPEIEEVIFSGGDPFMASDSTIGHVLERLRQLKLKRVRFHTRVPVTFPMRVTQPLLEILKAVPIPLVIVLHFNHPKEITPQSVDAIRGLRSAGVVLLNQSVLLKGVNDSAEALAVLSEGLFAHGVLPYYLHHPDRAAGTSHFDISMEEGLRIEHDLKTRLPGYLVPRYVIDVVGHPYKKVVSSFLQSGAL